MGQVEKANIFSALHVRGAPLVLCNVWDAGSAKVVTDAGAQAIATGSWGVAAAQGYADAEALPMSAALRVARQVVNAVDLPVSIDFEGGYAVAPEDVGRNVTALIETGAIGLNFEDRVVDGEGLHSVNAQAARIAAIRAAADNAGVPLFINARTDVFFSGSTAPQTELLAEALARAAAYADAGADGLFAPGVSDLDLISQLAAQDLPLNVMRKVDGPEITMLADVGVARISHGPGPYLLAMDSLRSAAADF